MKLKSILALARKGRADLAAMNLGSSGYSLKGLRILARYADPKWGMINITLWYLEGREEEHFTGNMGE